MGFQSTNTVVLGQSKGFQVGERSLAGIGFQTVTHSRYKPTNVKIDIQLLICDFLSY